MTGNKKLVVILLGLAISVFFLWYALRGTNFSEIWDSLSRARYGFVLPLLTAYALYYWVKAVRWRLLLMPMKETTTREVVSPMMIGFMGNNILPAHLGEFVRMYLGARQLELRNTQVLATIILERMFDFLSVVFFLGAVLLIGKDVPEDLVTIGYVTAIVGLGFMLVAAAYVTWTAGFIEGLRKVTFFVPHKIREGILHQLEIGALGLHSLKRPRLLVAIIFTSILQWGFMGVSTYMAILAMPTIDVRMSAAFVVLATTTFGVTLPAAPGFLGTVQAAFKAALIPYGVSEADAFAASVFFHVPTYLAVTVLGFCLLARTGYKLSELRDEAEAGKDET